MIIILKKNSQVIPRDELQDIQVTSLSCFEQFSVMGHYGL